MIGGFLVSSGIEIYLACNRVFADQFDTFEYHASFIWMWAVFLAANVLMLVELLGNK